MKRYRITHPSGVAATTDLNPAAVKRYRAKGYRIEYVGAAMVTVVRES